MLLVLTPSLQASLPGSEGKWYHYQSPNFELYSQGREAESREMLQYLEVFRHLFIEEMGLVERKKTPVTLYYFDREKDFMYYVAESSRKMENIAAVYMGDRVRGRMIIKSISRDDRTERLVFGQYIYHLLDSLDMNLPRWASMGINAVYSGTVVAEPNLEFGRPIDWHFEELRRAGLMPVRELFSRARTFSRYGSEAEERRLRAQSWFLVHYLTFGKTNLSPGTAWKLFDFLANNPQANPAQVQAGFEGILGITCEEMDKRLTDYMRRGEYTWGRRPYPKIPSEKTYEKRDVPRDEILHRLAEIAVRYPDRSEARIPLFDAARARPDDPRTWEALGSLASAEQDQKQAEENWAMALSKGSTSLALRRELLKLRMEPFYSDFEPERRLHPERVEELRKEIAELIAADPREETAYEYLIWLEVYAPKMKAANINRVQSEFSKLRQRHRTLVGLALARFRLNDNATALKMLSVVEAECTDPSVVWMAERLHAKIEERTADATKRPEAKPNPQITLPKSPL